MALIIFLIIGFILTALCLMVSWVFDGEEKDNDLQQ